MQDIGTPGPMLPTADLYHPSKLSTCFCMLWRNAYNNVIICEKRTSSQILLNLVIGNFMVNSAQLISRSSFVLTSLMLFVFQILQ